MKRLCVILQTIMLRRTKDAKYNGKRLLELPKRTVDVVTIEFQNDDEREFYEMIETRMKANLEESENEKLNMMGILVMLLRLRQGA